MTATPKVVYLPYPTLNPLVMLRVDIHVICVRACYARGHVCLGADAGARLSMCASVVVDMCSDNSHMDGYTPRSTITVVG